MATPRKSNLPWFVYIRVSSKDQGDKYGPARQVEAIRNWLLVNMPDARVPGLDACVVGPRDVRQSEYVGFDKQSGKTDDRRDFQRGYQMARDGRIAGFISYRLDRVARNAADAYLLRSRMKRMAVRLEFATQTFDDSPTGDLMYQVYASFAELEGKLILERTADGRKGRLADDKLFPNSNMLPYGYTYVDAEVAKRNPGAAIGGVIINRKEAKIVRLIFRLYIEEGETAYGIMMHLNRKKIPTRKGCAWWRESVVQVLSKADRYAGLYVVRLGIAAAKRDHEECVKLMGENAQALDLSGVTEVQLELPQIIDGETARMAQALRTQNKVKKAGRPSKQFPLSKLVYCAAPNGNGPCGGVWYFRNRGKGRTGLGYCSKHNYNCGGIHLKCRASEMAAEKLEGIVINAVKDYLRQPAVAHAAALQANREEHGGDANQRRAASEANLQALREQQEHFGSILLNPVMKKLHARANTQFAALEIQIQDLERELRRAPVSMIYSEASIVAAFQQKLKALDKLSTFEDKREFFQATVQRIDMTGQEVVIAGTIALPQEAVGGGGQNWKSGLDGASNFAASIPFVIRARVA